MKLICPKCKIVLNQIEETKVFHCTECDGKWVNFNDYSVWLDDEKIHTC